MITTTREFVCVDATDCRNYHLLSVPLDCRVYTLQSQLFALFNLRHPERLRLWKLDWPVDDPTFDDKLEALVAAGATGVEQLHPRIVMLHYFPTLPDPRKVHILFRVESGKDAHLTPQVTQALAESKLRSESQERKIRPSEHAFEQLHCALFGQWDAKANAIFRSGPVVRDEDHLTRIPGDIAPCVVLDIFPELASLLHLCLDVDGILVRDEFHIALRAAFEQALGTVRSVDDLEVGHEFDRDVPEPMPPSVEEARSAQPLPRESRDEGAQSIGLLSDSPDTSGNSRTADITEIYNPFLKEGQSRQVGGVIVTGHPGIGKSSWLYYVLVLRMLSGRPTLFQRSSEGCFISTSTGVIYLDSSQDDFDLSAYLPTDTWCLIDSDGDLEDVPQRISQLSRFIVKAAPPQMRRMEWHKQVKGISFFFMKPWSRDEAISGRSLQPGFSFTEKDVAAVMDKFGSSARVVFDKSSYTSAYETRLLKLLSTTSWEALQHALVATSSLDLSDDLSRRLFMIVPSATRGLYAVDFASRGIYHMISRSLRFPNPAALYRLCIQNPWAEASANSLLDYRVHGPLQSGGQWQLGRLAFSGSSSGDKKFYHPRDFANIILGSPCDALISSYTNNDRSVASLSPLATRRFATEEPLTLEDNVYYRPLAHDFGAFVYHKASQTAVVFRVIDEQDFEPFPSRFTALNGIRLVYVAVVLDGRQTIGMSPSEVNTFQQCYLLAM